MDSRTIKALEFGKVLEHLAGLCVSEAGRRVSLGLFPLRDADAVNAAHTLFDEVRTWSAHSGFRLSDFPDLEGLFPHLEKAAVSPSSAPLDADALWALRETLLQGRKAAQSINENGAMWPSLRDLVASMPLPEMTLSALSRCLGDDGLIKDESSPELMLVRGELRRLHLMCLRKVKDFAVQYNIAQYLQDDYMTLASDRYVLPLKSNFKGRIQGIIHDYSNTGETCYFEPLFLVEQNNRLQELKREEREEERKVLRYLTDIVQNELPFIRSAWDLLVRLDVELAKCGLAALFDGACATISPDGEDAPLSLLGARHPLLALDPQIRKQGGPHPVDLIFRPTDRALVISGGNAGGKTVCLKTLGLLAIMTLAGLPVPAAKGSAIPWWTSIHAFIGDEQSLDDHLSTFTAQIRHLGNAWEATDRRTLILLDEFGAGTDPAQGAALAQAVLDGLLERGAHVVAATHFPALKTYALTREGVRAASVLFDPGTKKPLFRLAYDQVGASQALDVAREHGLPESVLRRAEQYLLLDGQDMTAVMDRLNALAAKREGELDALKAEQQRTREKRKAVQERFERNELPIRTVLTNSCRSYEELLHMETLGEVIAWLDALRQDLSDFLLRESEKGGAKIVGMAQDWIAAHYREAASLQEAARAVSLNPSYFSTLLKKFTGKSYTELLMEYRIERAKELLLLTDAKVYRVGQMVGYEDKFYFSRIFKRVTGMTPVEFKNQRREG